jgi:hypothetical protein
VTFDSTTRGRTFCCNAVIVKNTVRIPIKISNSGALSDNASVLSDKGIYTSHTAMGKGRAWAPRSLLVVNIPYLTVMERNSWYARLFP